jgi:hypothetical protein
LLADFDAAADPGVGAFDEFNCFPNELFISHFNEQGGALDGTLVLLTTLPEQTGDENSVLLNFRFYNMDEHEISAQVEFDCMLVTSLADITPFVSNLPDNQNESGPWDRFRTGWVRIEPLDRTGDGPANGHAPVLGAFFQLAGSGFGAGTLLHMENQPGVYGGSNPTCTETRAQGSLPY